MKLKKCDTCKKYTLKEECSICKNTTKDAHYKYIKIRDAPPSTAEHFNKQRNN